MVKNIQLLCDTESNSPTCPNYGKQEEDRIRQQQEEMERRRQEEQRRRQQEEMERRIQEEQRRQQQEERRRQEQLERERTIQQEIERESELLGKKVSKGREKLRQKLRLKGQQRHHQRKQVLHQMIEDDAAAIRRDEPGDLKNKFEDLLKKYEITEDKGMQEDKLENRMKNLQNELTLKYFGEPQLSIWCQLTIDRAISQGEQSLTEQFSILMAVTELTLTNDSDTDSKEDQLLDWDQKYDFLIRLLEQLYSTNPTVAQQLVLSILDVFTEVSEKNKGLLSQILFNMIWTPSEILLFLQGVSGINQELATSILHTVQTNKLDLLSTLSALKDKDPVNSLQWYAEAEGNKDADTIVNEMPNEKYPEKILSIMKEILGYMTEELPKHAKEDLDQVKIEEAKQMTLLFSRRS
ncbi:GRB10-interacting GYF protein 2-like [Oncorhynchus tshawytscha]|uniref:GRB10-interacting GYF protein 2-like n=1 Tax=Oncorhynchus tshawytscha TaxID=74940 RepID=UPI001C3C361A|nr:GRB10-interacting GYF protein 2-like [Oncorhynchus tshawytscha]